MKLKSAIQTLTIALGTAAIPLVLLEIALRLFFPQPLGPPAFAYDAVFGQIPVPNQVAVRSNPEDGEYTISNDETGFRRTGSVSRNQAKVRILSSGASLTYGSGVNDSETYSAQIEKLLGDSEAHATVWNTGNPGTGTDYSLKLLQVRGPEIKPTYVLIGFSAGDFGYNTVPRYFSIGKDGDLKALDVASTYAFFKNKQVWLNSKLYSFACSHSHLLSLGRRFVAWSKLAGGTGALKAFLKGRPDFGPYERGLAAPENEKNTRVFISALLNEARRQQTQVLWVYLPSQVDIQRYQSSNKPHVDEDAFSRLMKETGGDSVSLTSAFAQFNGGIEALFLKEGHWTAAGHRLAAEVIGKALKQRLDRL